MTLRADDTNPGLSTDDAKPAAQKQPSQRPRRSRFRRIAVAVSLALGLLAVIAVGLGIAQYVIQSRTARQGDQVKGPEVVVPSKQKGDEIEAPEKTRDPIELGLDRMRGALQHSQEHIRDYTAIVTLRQRQEDGTLTDEAMFLKVRNRKLDADGNLAVPFAVYMKYLAPQMKAGREVIWIEGENDGKLIGHEPGLLNVTRYHLPPDGLLAMAGQRYPVWDIGLERLIEKSVDHGAEEWKREQCEVEFIEAIVDGHSCTITQITHSTREPHNPFYMAQMFIDDKRKIPLRYVAHLWREAEGEDPPLDEEYNYQEVKLNVGLTDMDFDPDNPEYNYP